jgi:chitinase
MARIHLAFCCALLAGCGTSADDVAPVDGSSAHPDAAAMDAASNPRDSATPPDLAATATHLWSMGYYASWQPTQLPVSEIEWSGLTHAAMSFYEPQSDGTLTLLGGDPKLASDFITAAHANGVIAIASIGGADSGPAFQTATGKDVVDAFTKSLVDLMDVTGYDGIDIDWEPLTTADQAPAIDLAFRIRAARDEILTITVGYQNVNSPDDLSGYPALAAPFDQMNIMSYGMAGAWQGWKSWHSSALHQMDSATPTSVDSSVALYMKAGVPASKLGVGIGFYGLCYTSPVTAPDQALNGSTIPASDGKLSFANILGNYYSANDHHYDDFAKAPYLSFNSPHAPDNCTYLSYEDDQSIGDKAAYVKSQGLGGVIIWEINEGHLANAPMGQRDPLLISIRDHILH